MLPFLDARPALPTHRDHELDADEIAHLRDLPPAYARPIGARSEATRERATDDDSDVPRLIADAIALREAFEAPSAGIGERALAAAITRRVRILEHTDDELGIAIRMLDRARLRLGPNDRARAARFGRVLAVAVHPRGEPDERALHKAAVWLGSLDTSAAARAIETLRRERAVLDADDSRCRAFHALHALLERART